MIITLTGENDFARQSELERLVGEFINEHGEMGLERLDGEEVDYQKIYDALTSLPFLASKKLVVIRNSAANKAFVEKSERLLSDLPESTDVVLVEPKLDKRSGFYKFLKTAADYREFNELDANGLAKWLADYAKEQKGSVSVVDARFLVERVGANQQLLKNEIDKLLLYDPKITRSSIELLTEAAPQSTIFELLDAAFAGDTQKALKLYAEQRALKVEPLAIIAMLTWQLNVLAFIKTAGQRSSDEIAQEAKLNPFVVRKSSGIARRLSSPSLKKLIQNLLTLDVRLKSEPIDADEALQNFLLQISE